MSLSLGISSLWVIAATLVAFLPMRAQYAPGLVLLVLAPVLLGFIAYQHGFWIFLLAFLGVVSMFRNPLIYLFKLVRRNFSARRKNEESRR